MKNNLSKTYTTTAIIAIALVSMLMLVPSSALAANPKSNPSNPITCSASPGPGTGVSSRTLTCTGKISGLGNVDQVIAQLQADVTTDCTNPGVKGHKPPGHITVVSQPQVFQVRNGAIDPFTAMVTASANCPPSQTPSVGQFTNVVILINGVPIQSFPGPF